MTQANENVMENEVKSVEIIVTNILPSATAFGVFASDLRQNVFIPARLSRMRARRSTEIGERITAFIVPNTTRPDNAQWLAVGFVELEDKIDGLADAILKDLKQGRATAEEVSESIGFDVDTVKSKLLLLCMQKRLVREETYDLAAEVSA